MGFLACVTYGFIGYFDFRSRSSRFEFWWWTLFTTLVYFALIALDVFVFGSTLVQSLNNGGVPDTVFSVLTFIPSLAVGCRRLHDIDRSGWWQILWLLPGLGWLVLIIWLARAGDPKPNSFGDDPFGTKGVFA